MSFNYEQSIWGKGYASPAVTSPTGFRLRQALRAAASLPGGSMVLEIGCGAGQFIRTIKKMRPDLDCYGCDISATAIEAARKMPDGVVYDQSGAVMPYPNSSFDAVFIFDVLEHVDDAAGLTLEVRRILKTGGIFYSFVPCEGDWLSLWRWCRSIGWKGDLTKKYAGHINYFSRRSLRRLYAENGFKQIRFNYSEHLLGQLLGIAAFILMDRAARRCGVKQINGEEYFESLNLTMAPKGLFMRLKGFVNALVFWESSLFSRLPSPNVHCVAKKLI
ncbi:MAG: hypothetical protein A3I29_04695 [Candidatus Magasanikbacteria bacterium RIFCSPLOWO2_02_FULL_44_11]|uniref:Methyltransferase type 11 domain-containing protein n=1 Tax=Candidatus Magasanikbacteria bacterium RIFCSPLOWO2_02_FULL_44_11 TaxID=1798689 RepID=A0A1F6N8L9_9BACT|nr:MAG: hypothetical protein A3I29_04695 [Candidatus Magasanikbacteria bacterium RIFCSPLOWO2_02_FULL_44_11]